MVKNRIGSVTRFKRISVCCYPLARGSQAQPLRKQTARVPRIEDVFLSRQCLNTFGVVEVILDAFVILEGYASLLSLSRCLLRPRLFTRRCVLRLDLRRYYAALPSSFLTMPKNEATTPAMPANTKNTSPTITCVPTVLAAA